MKLEVTKIEFLPSEDQNSREVIRVSIQTAEERLAIRAFHKKITGLLPIYVYKDKNLGYIISLNDRFLENLNKQKQEYDELVKQNPSTRVYKDSD